MHQGHEDDLLCMSHRENNLLTSVVAEEDTVK